MKISLLSFALMLTCSVFGQGNQNPSSIDWTKMGGNSNATFYQVQDAFQNYWLNKEVKKGSGYKPFKRWEAHMAPRVYPSGNMILPNTNYANYKAWEKGQGQNKSLTGNWSAVGPVGKPLTPTGQGYRTGTGRINFIRVNPSDPTNIFVGAPDGGVWRSTDNGASWSTNTDFLGVIGCNDLVFDPNNTQIIYLATGDIEGDRRSIGILKSIDGGNTWNPTSLSWAVQQDFKTSRLLMDPTNSNRMIVATNKGTYSTTDGWVTNTAASSFPAGLPDLKDAELKPGSPNTVYASGTELYKSTDFGNTWVEVTTGLPSSNISRIALAVTPANPNFVYAVVGKDSDQSFEGFYKSTNSATSFTTQYASGSSQLNLLGYEEDGSDQGSGQAFYDLVIAAHPTNANNVTVSSINQWQSNDGGLTWNIISHWTGDNNRPIIHSDFHEITYAPGASNTLYSGSDGGIWRSLDNGVTWTDLSNNLNISQINRFGISQTDATLMNAGMQDNGTNFKNANGWNNIFGGDGGESFIDHSDNNTLYFCYTNSEIHRSDDGGVTSNQVTTGLPHGGPSGAEFYSAFHQDPILASRVYAGGHAELYVTNNKGDNWSVKGTPSGSGNILEFAVAPSDNQVIYALKNDAVSKSINGGTSFSNITGTLPTQYASPSMVTVSKTNKNIVWVTFSGYSDGDKVFQSKNGGTTWVNLSAGLPNLPINTVVSVDNSVGHGVYIGADIGVYYYDSTITQFIPFITNLPRASVRDLEIHYATKKLRAATYGRGVWESDLYTNTVFNLAIECNGTNNVCNGANLGSAFVNISAGNSPYTYSWTNGGTTDTIKNIVAGTFTVTVTDAQNQVKSCAYTVTESSPIVVNVTGTEESAIGANDGSASVDPATGGTNTHTQTATYNFTGAPFSVEGPITTLSTISIPALPAGAVINSANLNIGTFTALGNSWLSDTYVSLSGDYTLAYTQLSTEDHPGLASSNPVINLPSFPTTGGTINLLVQEPTDDAGTDATFANVNITINYTLNGYTYSWSNGATTTSINSLTAGAYTVTVTDALGCTNTGTYNVNAPGANHTITASAGTNGSITPAGTTSIANHGNQTYTIAATSSCFKIGTVLIDGVNNPAAVSSGTYTFSNVTVDHTISATFVSSLPATPVIVANNANLHSDATTGNQWYNASGMIAGATGQTYVATASGSYYSIVTVGGCSSAQSNSISIHELTAIVGVNGTVSPTGSTFVGDNESQTYTITPGSCKAIATVLIDGVNNPAAVSSGSYTFSNVSADHTISATFVATTLAAPTVTVSNNVHFTSSAVSGNQWYDANGMIAGATGQHFDATTDGVYYSILTSGGCTSSASNSIAIHEITATTGANGSVSPSGSKLVSDNGSQTYTITADACKAIGTVLIDGVNNTTAVSSGTYTFSNVTANHTISATFIASTLAAPVITVANNVDFTSDVTLGNQWYDANGMIAGETGHTFTATAPGTYYSIATAGGCISSASNSISIHEIDAYVSGNGTISPEGYINVSENGSQTFTFTPDNCYKIDSVYIDGVNNSTAVTSGTYTFNSITVNQSIEVVFSYSVETPTIVLSNGVDISSDAVSGNQWYNSAGTITGETGQNFTATSDDTYHTIVTVNGCSSDASNEIVVSSTGITTINGNQVNVYPNPVYDELIIEIPQNSKLVNFEILNIEGKVVFKSSVTEKTIVKTSDFAKGTYIIKLENEEVVKFKKIVKN